MNTGSARFYKNGPKSIHDQIPTYVFFFCSVFFTGLDSSHIYK